MEQPKHLHHGKNDSLPILLRQMAFLTKFFPSFATTARLHAFFIALLFFLSACDENKTEENRRLLKAYPLLGAKVPERLLDEVRYLEGACIEDKTGKTFAFANDVQWVWHLFSHRNGQPERVQSPIHHFSWEPVHAASQTDWTPPPNTCEVSLRLDVVDEEEVEARCGRWIKSKSTETQAAAAVQQRFNATCIIKVSKRLDCFPEDHFDGSKQYSKEWQTDHAKEACAAPERDDYKVQVKRRWQEIIDRYLLQKEEQQG
jgi:hypothetical protein